MDFPKKQAQRLMPLYLLEYSEKLFTNHPDPSAPWGGGGGSDYTAGQGITITNNEISVDTNVIATKSDIAQMVTTTQLNDALDDYALKTEIPTDVSQLYNDAGYATQTWVENKGYATSSEIPTVNNPTITFTQGGTTKGTITLNQSGDQTIEFDASASLPDSPFLKVDDPQDQMFFSLDGSDSSWYKYVDLSATPNRMFRVNLSALNPVFKDGLTSTYNEQTNQLEVGLSAPIPDTTNFVTTDTNQTISGFKTFDSGKLSVERLSPIRMTLTFRPNMFIYIAGDGVKYFKLPTGKSSGTADAPTEYTLATTDDIPSLDGYALKSEVPSTATSTSTSTVTPTTGTFVTGTSTNTTNVVNSVTYTPSAETLTFTYDDNTTASFTFLTSNTTVTSGTTSVVSSVTDSTSNAMTGATVSTSTTTTLS